MEKVEKYIRDEKMEKEKINEIVLVGGQKRIKKVKKMMKDLLNGKEMKKQIKNEEDVE